MNSLFESFYYCCQRIFEWLICKKQPTYTTSILETEEDFPYKRYTSGPSGMI